MPGPLSTVPEAGPSHSGEVPSCSLTSSCALCIFCTLAAMAPRQGSATCAAALVLSSLVLQAQGDVYMHNPRGSNDRNCERNVNRNNGNRLFDTNNNEAGKAVKATGS